MKKVVDTKRYGVYSRFQKSKGAMNSVIVPFIFSASNEPNSVLARGFGDYHDNLRNPRSVFLIVEKIYNGMRRIFRDYKAVETRRVAHFLLV